eukprot:g9089.t1
MPLRVLLLVVLALHHSWVAGRSVVQKKSKLVVVSTEAKLQEAVGKLEPGQTLELDFDSVELTRRLLVNVQGVEIRGKAASTVLRCPSNDNAMVIEAPVIVSNVEFWNCSKQSAVVVQSSRKKHRTGVSAIFRKVSFHQNGASNKIQNGAALAILGCLSKSCMSSPVDVLIEECSFAGNRASGGGGAIFGSSCKLKIISSEFRNNTAEFAGGGVLLTGGYPTLQIQSSTFMDNRVRSDGTSFEIRQMDGLPLESSRYFTFAFPQGSGGAVAINAMSSLLISESEFIRNQAPAGGALSAVFHEQSSKRRRIKLCSVVIRSSTFKANKAIGMRLSRNENLENNLGGAIYFISNAGKLKWKLVNSTFERNEARHGGGLHIATLRSIQPEIQYCLFNNNVASGAGGGFLARNTGAIQLEGSMFSKNNAAFGGGVMLTNSASMAAIGLTGLSPDQREGVANRFVSDSAVDGGGLMCAACGDLDLQDTLFISNTAEGSGGGIYCLDTPNRVTLSQIKMLGNHASSGGGAAFLAAADVQISAAKFDGFFSSILNNTATAGAGVYIKANRQYENRIQISRTLFSNNIAFQSENTTSVSSDCGNGGGGGACLILNSIPDKSIADVRVFEANFTNNKASVGGGIFVNVSGEMWNVDRNREQCADRKAFTASCRLLAFSDLRFLSNQAESGSEDIFISNPDLALVGCASAGLKKHVPWSSVLASHEATCLYRQYYNNVTKNGY